MKQRAFLRLAVLLALATSANARYVADPIVRYKIDAPLDAKNKTINGHEIIQWRNHSADLVPDLQFHLYLNAFKNNYSTFMREGGATSRRVKFLNEAEAWGYEQIRSLKVNGNDLTSQLRYIQPDDGNPYDQTVARVPLPAPIAGGGTVTIEIQWTSKLPHIFARTGCREDFCLVAQWFPKPCVWEAKGERHRAQSGWNCHQFHTSTEFYADYGTFDVNLTVPSDFEIAATGAERGSHHNGDGTTTYNYYQEDVHDFAWTTQPKSQAIKVVRWFKADEQVTPSEIAEWSRKTAAPPEDVKLQDVKVTLFAQREHTGQVDRHFKAAFAGLKWFGLFYGKYPYDVLTFVDPPPFTGRGAGGMEYPTFFTAGTEYWPGQHKLDPEGVIVHEFGHQFWYGLVGNNEFEEAWLDEGFNSYSTGKVLERAYGPNYSYAYINGIPFPAIGWIDLPVPRYPWYKVGNVWIGPFWEWVAEPQKYGRTRSYWNNARTDAMERYAWLTLDRGSYQDQAYSKPELTLRTLEALLGDAWPRVIRAYHQRWRFKHPDAIDFMDTVREVSGQDMKWFFDQTVYGAEIVNYSVSFTDGHEPEMKGYFDRDGKPAMQTSAGDDKDDSGGDPNRPREAEVLVRRLGRMRFPVQVVVKFEDGSEDRKVWDLHSGSTAMVPPPPPGAVAPSVISDEQYRWIKYKYFGRPRIVSAEVDPDFQIKLEVARTDNSALREPVRLAADKWYLRWVVWLQNVLMSFSYFG